VLLADLAATSEAVAATPARSAKIATLAELLARASPVEVGLTVRYLTGELRQRRTGLGVAALRDLAPAAAEASLTVLDVDEMFAAAALMSGPGSSQARRTALADVMARATASEQRLLAGLVSGELRQGAAAGVMLEAVAVAGGVPADQVRTAVTLAGSLPEVAHALRAHGPSGLDRFRLTLGTPLAPMLAQSAPSMAEALDRFDGGQAAVEWKVDGIRVQLHRDGEDVAVFSRSGDDLTTRVPELVTVARGLPVRQAVLDGEAIVLRSAGRPAPFQVTGSRVGRRGGGSGRHVDSVPPLHLFAFDVLHLDGADLLGLVARERWVALDAAVPADQRIPRLHTAQAAEAEQFTAQALGLGHEGAVVKSPEAPYAAGRRGAAWVKVKPRIVLDLVVLAAEWGHGRRRGWLSNLHLGARDPAGRFGAPGGYVMLGKTFKGMTDAMLAWQTERLLALATGPADGWVVPVRPELVAEIAIDGVQASTRYPGGVALRFARVLRYRADKAAGEADTVDAVRELLG
jgi:DNA ligase 1